MALIIPPGYAQVLIPFKYAGFARSAAVTFGVNSGEWVADYPGMCNRIAEDFRVPFQAALQTEVTVGPVKASIGQDASENLAVQGTFTFAGTGAGESVASNTALLISKLTSRGGRRGRGRIYVPWCISETVVNELGVIAAGTVTSFQTAANTLLTRLAAEARPVPMVILHTTGSSPTGLPNSVTSLQVQSLVGTQRRRLGRK